MIRKVPTNSCVTKKSTYWKFQRWLPAWR